MRRKYFTLDVFTDTALAGNPLAVVLDCAGLDDARMQAIAREFNLAETVFVFEPRNPVNTARIRIFTPQRELPFAGHPTVGCAILLAHVRAPDLLRREDLRIVLEESVGDVICEARHRLNQAMAAWFTLPKLPQSAGEPPPMVALASALGLDIGDLGFDRHVASLYSAGTPFLFIPVNSLAAMAKARPAQSLWGENGEPAAFLYGRETKNPEAAIHARMFAGGWGIVEDPATGGAAAALAGVLTRFEKPADGDHMITIEQGLEMGRPSFISLGMTIADGALRSATIGGSAVVVGEGHVDL